MSRAHPVLLFVCKSSFPTGAADVWLLGPSSVSPLPTPAAYLPLWSGKAPEAGPEMPTLEFWPLSWLMGKQKKVSLNLTSSLFLSLPLS